MKTKQEYINEISEAGSAKINTLLRQALSDPGISGTGYVEIRNAYEARCEYLAESRQKPTNNEGINRRNIPVNFMDYIAQKHGYDAFTDIKKKSHFSRISAEIKERFSQTGATIRKPYSTKTQIVLRGDDETPLDFAIRIDNLMLSPKKSILSVPGDAETLSLSDLNPELVKQVAAELLELEKTAKYQVHDEYVFEVDDANKRSIEKLINLAANYGMKTFGRSVVDADLAMQKWREALDAYYNDPATIARRYGQMLSNAIPKKHAFAPGSFVSQEDSFKFWVKTGDSEKLSESDGTRRWWPTVEPIYDTPANNMETKEAQSRISGFGWDRVEVVYDPFPRKKYFAGDTEVFPETGPEQIIDRAGKTRIAPADLKIETNQQWSPEELKDWLEKRPGNTQQMRKPYVFHEDKIRKVNSIADAIISDAYATARAFNSEPQDTETLKDHQGNRRFWPAAEIKIRNYTPDNWPPNAPPYHTPEGWEFEKSMKRRQLKSMLTIEWLEKQQTEKHALVAKRLREILAA